MEEMKKKETLEDVISKITSKYNIEQIYLNTYDRKREAHELIVLVSNKYIKNLGDVVPRMVNTIRNYPHYQVRVYVAFQAKDKIREGNLFLFVSCQPEKLVYRKENSEFELLSEEFDFNKCKALTIDLKNLQREKVEEFKGGYYHFKEKEQYSLASFMLHQAIELTYRHLEIMLAGKERITHSVRTHHMYMKKISSMYHGVFEEEEHEDYILLQVLEDIYGASRYEDYFDIDPEVLEKLEVKMERLHVLADQIFQQVLITIEQQYAKHLQSMERTDHVPLKIAIKKLEDYPKLKDVTQQLNENLPEPVSIYLFGHRTLSFSIKGINEHESTEVWDNYFDLLVVSKTDIRVHVGNLQALIHERLGTSVFLLSYTKTEIQKELDKNSPFFHQVLSGGETLLHAGIDVGNWCFHKGNGLRAKERLESDRISLNQRIDNASGLLRAGAYTDDSVDPVIKVLLYNQALEQACLGLLEFFYGYTPYQYSLNHLYGLCSTFWSFPNELFSRATAEERKQFTEFSNVLRSFRYKGVSDFDSNEVDRYEVLCHQFIERSAALARESFVSD